MTSGAKYGPKAPEAVENVPCTMLPAVVSPEEDNSVKRGLL